MAQAMCVSWMLLFCPFKYVDTSQVRYMLWLRRRPRSSKQRHEKSANLVRPFFSVPRKSSFWVVSNLFANLSSSQQFPQSSKSSLPGSNILISLPKSPMICLISANLRSKRIFAPTVCIIAFRPSFKLRSPVLVHLPARVVNFC